MLKQAARFKNGKPWMQIETLDHRTIGEADARAIAELLIAIWPKPGRTVETRTAEMLSQWKNYRGPEAQYPRSFLVRESGRVVAHAEADPRTVRTPMGELTVLALCRVCSDPAVRGKKLGRAVVEAAFDLVDDGAYPFALFQTRETVRPFYEKLGATPVGNRFFNSLGEDPTASPFWDPVIMRYPSTGAWPTGDIDTNGPGW
jgi:predicted N-acetyltransferase YhbS